MKLTSATTLSALVLAFAGAEATKPGIHGGRLTIQDLLVLRNGVILPEMMADSSGERSNAGATASAHTPRATDAIPEGYEICAEDAKLGVTANWYTCSITAIPGHFCASDRCSRHEGHCRKSGDNCYNNFKRIKECDGCQCTRDA